MSTKLKKEELEKVQELNGKLGQLKSAIGDIHIAIDNVNEREKNLMSQWKEAQSKFNAFGEELRETYGNVNIDISTGEISDPDTPQKEVADDNQTDS